MQVHVSHLTSLFENATEGIILTNGTCNILLVNSAIERIFSYADDELTNKPIKVLISEKVKPHRSA